MEDILSAWLTVSSQLTFTIIIAGKITGGVFEDAFHKPISYEVGVQLLVIRFERDESLTVFHPANLSLGSDALLVVRDASEARFAWYEHGRPHQPENLCEEIFYRVGRFADFYRIVPRVIPPSVLEPFPATGPLPPRPFVQLIPNRRASGRS